MKKLNIILLITSFILSSLNWSCEYNNEDAPPVEPFIPGEIVTVAEVKSLYDEELNKYWTDRVPVEITENITIKGIITADDKTSDGNLYKEAYVQDESAGLRLTFQSTGGLYVNDSVTINLKGLYLSDYGDFIQLGGVPYFDDSNNYRLTGIDKHDHIRRTVVDGQELLPEIVTISQIGEAQLGKLVQLNDVQFKDSELGKTYATPESDGVPASSQNRILVDCSGNSILVRSSGYATFAGDKVPTGKGSFVGIVTKFNRDLQLIIRHIEEVELNGNRCN